MKPTHESPLNLRTLSGQHKPTIRLQIVWLGSRQEDLECAPHKIPQDWVKKIGMVQNDNDKSKQIQYPTIAWYPHQ